MFDQKFVRTAIDRSAENEPDRRRFLRAAGLTGIVGAGAVAMGSSTAVAQENDDRGGHNRRPSDRRGHPQLRAEPGVFGALLTDPWVIFGRGGRVGGRRG